jgi:hypothetical protein
MLGRKKKKVAPSEPKPESVLKLSPSQPGLRVLADVAEKKERGTLVFLYGSSRIEILMDKTGPFSASGEGVLGKEALIRAAALQEGKVEIWEGWPKEQPVFHLGLDSKLSSLISGEAEVAKPLPGLRGAPASTSGLMRHPEEKELGTRMVPPPAISPDSSPSYSPQSILETVAFPARENFNSTTPDFVERQKESPLMEEVEPSPLPVEMGEYSPNSYQDFNSLEAETQESEPTLVRRSDLPAPGSFKYRLTSFLLWIVHIDKDNEYSLKEAFRLVAEELWNDVKFLAQSIREFFQTKPGKNKTP